MTFPTIPTVGAGRVLSVNQANTTATRTFPNLSSLTKNSGDLLIAIAVAYQTSTGTNAAFSGWTGGFAEFHDSATSTTMAIGCAYKWSTGSETGTFAVTQAGTITGHATMILLSIPGAHASTPPEAGGRVSGTSTSPAPGALNPAAWDVEDTLWIAVGGCGETSTTGSFTGVAATNPTGWTDVVATTITADAVGGLNAAVSFIQFAAASEGSGSAFTNDTSNARNAAIKIAVRPAAGIPQGAASGATDWAGSATGARVSTGPATGAVTWAGAVTGSTVHAGSAAGSVAWSGAATGEQPPNDGSASGAVAWAGSATGARTSSGPTTGTVTWAGSATGASVHSGGVSGTTTRAGTATGTAVHSGGATGAVTWAGSATGEAPTLGGAAGSATGTLTWTGAATGATQKTGAASGTLTWGPGSTTGTRSPEGAAVGTTSWVGTATGEAPGVGINAGSASGTMTWTGVATGATPHAGAIAGTMTWIGAVTGARASQGAAAGSYAYTGSATGSMIDPGNRDLVLSASLDRPRLTGMVALDQARASAVLLPCRTDAYLEGT